MTTEAQGQFVPKPLGAYLKRNYDFSTQADTVEAMTMGKELFLAGRQSGLEAAARLAEQFYPMVVGEVDDPIEMSVRIAKLVAAAIREIKEGTRGSRHP